LGAVSHLLDRAATTGNRVLCHADVGVGYANFFGRATGKRKKSKPFLD
jgi:hypothetical protein